MRVLIESLLLGDLSEAKKILDTRINHLVNEQRKQAKLSLVEDIYGDYGVSVDFDIEELDETIKNNVQRMGRTKLVKLRIRGGKIQRRKKLSNVKGYTTRSGSVKRMSALEIRHRKISARKAKFKRRVKLQQSLRKRQRSLRKRHAMGL
jgi:hypothetical protein